MVGWCNTTDTAWQTPASGGTCWAVSTPLLLLMTLMTLTHLLLHCTTISKCSMTCNGLVMLTKLGKNEYCTRNHIAILNIGTLACAIFALAYSKTLSCLLESIVTEDFAKCRGNRFLEGKSSKRHTTMTCLFNQSLQACLGSVVAKWLRCWTLDQSQVQISALLTCHSLSH